MSDGDGSRDDDVEDSASSTAGSASRADIEAIVSERVGLLGKDIKDTLVKDIQGKLESFRANVLDMMNSRLNQIESNLPIPAPQPILVQQSLGKGRSDPPHSSCPDGATNQGNKSVGPVWPSNANPSPSASKEAHKALESLQAMLASGVITPDEFQ